MMLGKQAACLRTVGSTHPQAEVAKLEDELQELGNKTGLGAMGFKGTSTVVSCNIEVGYTHTGGMPMSMHCFCLSSRRATARLHASGEVEYRTDPQWFTPYMRRNSVDWDSGMKEVSHG
jgi:L(+)-tartrate dehydratase alpha subunit